jgi:hypothetical protein
MNIRIRGVQARRTIAETLRKASGELHKKETAPVKAPFQFSVTPPSKPEFFRLVGNRENQHPPAAREPGE